MWKLRKFTLTISLQKFREIDALRYKLHCMLFSRNIFILRVNFSNFLTVPRNYDHFWQIISTLLLGDIDYENSVQSVVHHVREKEFGSDRYKFTVNEKAL